MWVHSRVLEALNTYGDQVCFMIDLPRLPETEKAQHGTLTEFAKELLYFTRAMGLDQKIIDSMNKFDFSRTSHLAFVHTMLVLPA